MYFKTYEPIQPQPNALFYDGEIVKFLQDKFAAGHSLRARSPLAASQMEGKEKVFSLFGRALVADKTLYNKGMGGFFGCRISPFPNYIGRKKSQLESIKDRAYHSSQVYRPGGAVSGRRSGVS